MMFYTAALFLLTLLPFVHAHAQPALPNFNVFDAPPSAPAAPSVSAGEQEQAQENIGDTQQCFIVRNMMENSIYGQIATDEFTRDDGVTTRHRGNFKLAAIGETDPETGAPLDIVEFCTTGPFFDGNKIQLELKTLFPIFSCFTRVDQGQILVRNARDEQGTNKIWAECFE